MILKQLRRHAAITTGNFQKLFGDLELPALPVAVARLVELSARDDAEIAEYADVIRSDTALASRVLRLVNSAAMGVRHRVADIDRAVGLLGMRQVGSLGLAVGVSAAVPMPASCVFDPNTFWHDSLLAALVAKALAKHLCPEHTAEAFAGALLQNVAVPILLDRWADYYEPVIAQWLEAGGGLARIEQERFKWNHAEAGAWIVRSWGLPDDMVCAVGLHHASWEQLADMELESTPVAAGALAALLPSVLSPAGDMGRWSQACSDRLGLDAPAQQQLLGDVHDQLIQTSDAFGLAPVTQPNLAEHIPA
jgi:HD-like signal output (HDOD) protein